MSQIFYTDLMIILFELLGRDGAGREEGVEHISSFSSI